MNILDALTQSKQSLASDYYPSERVMIDGMLSICDEVFECELWKIGVDKETIDWRLKEPVGSREAVIEMYRGYKNATN